MIIASVVLLIVVVTACVTTILLATTMHVMVPIIVDYILGVGKTHSPRIATPHKYFDLEES